jgi:hypothetical protein
VTKNRTAFAVDMAVKAALVGLLVFSITFPDAPRFEGRAMTGRALVYPISVLIVPVAWWVVQRRRGRPVAYPYALDILLVAPFLIDTLSNAVDLYDSIGWWDDADHFVSWALFVAAFGQLLVRLPIGRLEVASLAIGFGAVTAILWELAEYVASVHSGLEEEAAAYAGTVGDLALGLSGSCVAALLTVTLLWPRSS